LWKDTQSYYFYMTPDIDANYAFIRAFISSNPGRTIDCQVDIDSAIK